MLRKNASLWTATIVAGAVVPAFAQQPGSPSAPANPPKPAEVAAAAGSTDSVATPIIARAVKGRVFARSSPDAERKQVAQGDVLSAGSELTTTLNSAIELQVGVGQVFTIDRLTRVIIREAIASQGKETTKVAVPYGRVSFDVSSATVSNDVQIQAPDATLAVKGTQGGMEVTPGFPTLAFGGDFNHGVFDVSFQDDDVVAGYRGSEQANNAIPEVARYELEQQFVNTGDVHAQEGDEYDAVRDYQTSFFFVGGAGRRHSADARSQSTNSLDLETALFYFEELSGELHIRSLGGLDAILRDAEGQLKPILGAAIIPDFESKGSQLSRLLYTLTTRRAADGSEHQVLSLTSISEFGQAGSTDMVESFERRINNGVTTSYELSGLGAIGQDLFTAGTRLDETQSSGGGFFSIRSLSTIFEIDRSEGGLNARMVLPMRLENGAMTGVGSRGSLFVMGNLTGEFRLAGAGANATLLEVDPRNNYLVMARSAPDGDLVIPNGGGVTAANLRRVTGMAYVGNTLVMIGVDVNGRRVLVQYDPGAGRVRRLDSLPVGSFGQASALASGAVMGPVPNPRQLAEPTSPIDLEGINQTFAQMAFSSQAARSLALRGLVAEHIANAASDPAGCRASAELNGTGLRNLLQQHANQRAGVGQVVFRFRNSLSPGHPCRPPGGPG